jgi:hypothetical protein
VQRLAALIENLVLQYVLVLLLAGVGVEFGGVVGGGFVVG